MTRCPRALVALFVAMSLSVPAVAQTPGSGDTVSYRCAGIGATHLTYADVCFTLWTYMRYLNQQGIHGSYTDAFGRSFTVKRRNDLQNNKLNVGLRGWIYDPRFRFAAFTWTSGANQGELSVVAVGGFLFFDATPRLTIGMGAGSLPSTRTTEGTFPNWLRVDNRAIADEYFRASYTMAVWLSGQPVDGLKYEVMLGNNLSGFGVDAQQLDAQLNTWSAALWWMPTTKEYGPLEGYGDFEHHDKLATLLGVHLTGSREDKQSQPDQNAIENTQIRVSDGTNIFQPGAFADSTQIGRATYRMLDVDGGLKYRGLSLDAEYLVRWVGGFQKVGPLPVTSLFDQGFQAQASAMLRPKLLQAYLSGSQIFGQYGRPWDVAAGMNYFPFRERHFRLNAQAVQLYRSPVGYLALPYPLGATGLIFTFDVELFF